MKRILSMLCVLAIMLGMITVPAFAAAESAVQQDVTVLSADAENLTVESDTYIDLNGHSIAGVTVADGATLYVSDSQTDDYDVADGIYGAVTGISGAVAAAEGYIAITEEGAVSYHKVDLTLTSMTLRPAVAGVYYNSVFAADAVVARNVVSYGVALSVAAEPTAENLDTLCGYSTITGFEEGEKSGTLLTGVMNESNTDYANDRNAAMAIYGRAYIKTAEGYTFGACASRNLKTQVEAIDTVFASLKEAQSAAILAMYAAYESVMANWNVPNIKHAAVTGDTVITVPVAVEDGEVTETVTVEQDGVSITIPFGTLVEADELTLTVTRKSQSDSGIEAEEGQTLMPFDVHVEGLSSENEAPLTIALGKVMPENLNLGNYSIYHVEADGTKEMELVDSAEKLTDHNQFAYTLDGELTLNMASFSEAVAVINDANAWNNGVDHSWYDAEAENLYIRNADQLWSLSQIVGGMAEGIDQDGFAGKTVTLLADISIGDTVSDNGKVFYPIGYWNNQETYENLAGIEGVSSGFYAFQGTFDGNGNTISDFYQNTWEMEGDYNDGYPANPNYYRDGMGLFGNVYGGTVKNLTVKNFQCDSEHGTTGAIAAYADCGATFENIAIFDCNPRVYNIGNGGIVGAVGWYANDAVTVPVTFKNITVDSSNKISALWGTYDAACGGLVGQYYPTSGQNSAIKNSVRFENCHVAAEMDVNNDVCGNYQYYWYRYCGMFIGSTRENKTENVYTVANADSVTAVNCTYNIGKWNNYYYCELVANSQASYTHDHQMSRLVPVANVEGTTVTPLEGEAFTVPATGRYNYVVVSGEHATENATCYHFVDGAVWNHAEAGEETVNGATVLKEDKQHIYLPFNQLMTGYGWGVKAYQEFPNINPSADQLAQSSEKFTAKLEQGAVISADTTSIPVSQLFAAKEGANINESTVHVFISPVGENSTVVPTYVCVTNNELDDIAALPISGAGKAKITITDYYFCLPTTINVFVEGFGRVTSVDQITAGGEFVIVANVDGVYKALSTDIQKNIEPVDVTVENGVVVGTELPVWTISATESGILLKSGDSYLSYRSSTDFDALTEPTNNSIFVVEEQANSDTFTIVFSESLRGIAYRTSTINQFRAYATSNYTNSGYYGYLELYKWFEATSTCAHNNTETTPAVDKTCTTDGKTAEIVCADCGKVIQASTVIPKGHGDLRTENAVDATCGEEGYTGDKYCTVCGEQVEAGTIIEATGEHSYGDDGICTVCGAEENPTIQESFAGRYYIATIRTSGNYWYMTSDLGTASTKRYQAVDSGLTALPTDITAPEAGYEFELIKNNDGTYCIQAVGVEGNNYLGWTSGNSGALVAEASAVKATVEAVSDAINIHFTASDAERYLALNGTSGNNYFAWYKSGQKQDLVLIPVKTCEHANQEAVEAVGATCTEAGKSAGVVCSDCGAVISGCEKTEALGHNYGEGVVTTAPSCTATGVKTYTCSACDDTKTETIDMIDHNYVDGKCSMCGATESTEPSEPTVVLEITKDDFNSTSYAANNNTKTEGDYSYTSYQVMNQSSVMQWQKSKGYITIASNAFVKLELKVTAGTFTVTVGGKTVTGTTSNGITTYNLTGLTGEIKISVGSATGKVDYLKFYK